MPSITHLLDTQAWLWFFNRDPRAQILATTLPATARLGVSAITIWEAAMLEAKGRVQFRPDLETFVRNVSARQVCPLVPLLPAIAIASARLKGLHGDPADRIIVATAVHTGATLVTADGKIIAWARLGDQLPVLAL